MMKTKFNFWGVMAAAAIILSAGAGYASATSQDEEDATHYNSTPLTDLDQTPRWEPIDPNGEGSLACTLNEARACKAIQDELGDFEVTVRGNYPGL